MTINNTLINLESFQKLRFESKDLIPGKLYTLSYSKLFVQYDRLKEILSYTYIGPPDRNIHISTKEVLLFLYTTPHNTINTELYNMGYIQRDAPLFLLNNKIIIPLVSTFETLYYIPVTSW